MRSRSPWPFLIFLTLTFAGWPSAGAGEVTLSHSSSALPGAPGPAITLLSITGDNEGTNYTFTLTFANPTIEGPSSGNPDAVYGFINIDADKNAATGVTGAFLDSNSFEPGFGRYSPSSEGIDTYINLGSEGDPLHGAPGLVDVVTTDGFNVIDTVPITYTSHTGSTPSMLSFSIPLTDFSRNQIPLLDTGNFSVIVGNVNNATDFLPAVAAVPEPASLILLSLGVSLAGLASVRLTREPHPTRQR
ncbi:MAG TPA: PEP-CTERM sorting domain-containing protein [Isosphaeraceae bacterium]|nr:PEP-CTERM sorting domain-containing protein [Isosphaeraceae bacterium]